LRSEQLDQNLKEQRNSVVKENLVRILATTPLKDNNELVHAFLERDVRDEKESNREYQCSAIVR
jgi:hypothetical protein